MKNKTHFNKLILKCPFNESTNECAFEPYRLMPLIELIENIHAITSQELNDMLAQHDQCFKKRNTCRIAG